MALTSQELALVLRARDEASQVLKQTNTALGQTEQQLERTSEASNRARQAWGAVAGFVGTAVVGALSDAARAAADEEAGIARLDQALANAGLSYADLGQSIEAKILAQQNSLAFGDGPQRDSLAALVAITKDADQAFQLQALAMDLSRAKSIDLRTATDLIGRVYAGNMGTLSRYGIVLKEGATVTEALGEVQAQVGGQAQRFGDTTAGSIAKVGLTLGDLQETIGGALGPFQGLIALLPGTSVAFQAAGAAVGFFASQNGLATVRVMALQAVLLPVRLATMAWTAVQAALNLVLSLNPIGIVVLAIAGLVAALKFAYDNSAEFRAIVQSLWDWLGRLLAPLGFVGDAIMGIARAMGLASDEVQAEAQDMSDGVTSTFASMEVAAYQAGAAIPEAVAQGISDRTRRAEFAALQLANVTITTVTQGVGGALGDMFDAGYSVSANLGNGLSVGLEQTQIDAIKKTGFIPASMKKSLLSEIPSIHSSARAAGAAVKEGLVEELDEAAKEAEKKLDAIRQLFDRSLNDLQRETEKTLDKFDLSVVGELGAVVGTPGETSTLVTFGGEVFNPNLAARGRVPEGLLPRFWTTDTAGNPVPVFHGGGVIPGPLGANIPIIAQAGEMVLTRQQQQAIGGDTHVHVTIAGPVFGMLDLEQKITQTVKDAARRGAFRQVLT